MPTASPLDRIATVLVEPRSADNVGGALRALRNMGLSDLRLVRPANFDWRRLAVAAHRSQAQIDAIRVFDDLDHALADAVYVVGATSRRRAARLPVLTPRQAADAALARVDGGPVAFLYGREDVGLSRRDLERCHALLTVPTAPDYASLNLAQAVLIVAYELRLAADAPLPPPRSAAPATAARMAALFVTLDQALDSAGFLIPSRAEATRRAVRAIAQRAELTDQEAALVTAMLRALRPS